VTIQPDITRGLNEFTPGLFNRMVDAVNYIEQQRQQIDSLLAQRKRRPIVASVPALITGYQAIADTSNRWAYAFVEGVWNPSTLLYEARTGGINSGATDGSSFDTPAYNRLESMNDGLRIESGGVHIEGADFPKPPQSQDPPQGFYLQPLQGDWNPPAGDDPAWTGNPADEDPRTWGVAVAPTIRLWLERNSQGNVSYLFDWPNVVDGRCLLEDP
jgi:hypothetical protein